MSSPSLSSSHCVTAVAAFGRLPPTHAWAKSFFGAKQTLVVDVQQAVVPDLRDLDIDKHKCVVFDEMGPDGAIILRNKKLMQAHIDGTKLGQSPTQGFTYPVWLHGIAIVCTTNYWPPVFDEKKPKLEKDADDDWIEQNVIAVHVQEATWVGGDSASRRRVGVL